MGTGGLRNGPARFERASEFEPSRSSSPRPWLPVATWLCFAARFQVSPLHRKALFSYLLFDVCRCKWNRTDLQLLNDVTFTRTGSFLFIYFSLVNCIIKI